MQVFLRTTVYREKDDQIHRQVTMRIPSPANCTNLMITYAMQAVDVLFKQGYNFHKARVIVLDIVPQTQVQACLRGEEDKSRSKRLMKAINSINTRIGAESVKYAVQGNSQRWKLRSDYMSSCLTTQLEQVLTIKG